MYTTGLENNDYQVFNTRPVELPLNDMFKAVLAKNEYWNQGAAKIKNTYDSALGMDLTLDANKQVKNDYLLKTQDKIKQLSSMDLGDYEVQKQGLDLFTPLLQDKAIQYDNAITKHLHSIYQDAESYKDRSINGKRGEEGDGYSDKNLAYALKDFKAFDNKLSRDPKALENIWNQNKNASYVPYHNVYKESQDIMKTCKGASTESQTPNGMYLQDRQNSGADPAQVRECLQSNLSDRANQQIKIDAWAQFNQDPHTLADYTIKNYEAKVKDYDTAITSYKAKEDALSGIIKKTPEQEQQLAKYKQYRDFYTTQKSNLGDVVDKYNKGDIDYFKKNYEQLAFEFGKEQYLNNASQALRTDKSVDKFTANPVAINISNWQNKFRFQDIGHQNSMQLEDMKLAGANGGKDSDYIYKLNPQTGRYEKELKPIHLLTPDLNEQAKDNSQNYIQFQQQNASLINDLETSLKDLQGKIQRATNGDLGPLSKSISSEAKGGYYPIVNNKLIDYNKDGKIDQSDIDDWKNNYIKSINEYTGGDKTKLKPAQQTALDLIDDWGKEQAGTITRLFTNKALQFKVENSIPEEKKNASAAAKAIKDIAYANGTSINSLDIVNAIEGKSDKIKLNYSNNNNYNNSTDPLNQSSGNGQVNKVLTSFTINGKLIDVYSPYYNSIENIYNKVNKVENKRIESLNKTRNELYGAMNLNTGEMIAAGTFPQSEKNFETQINRALGEDGKVKVVLHGYDALHGGKATFEVKKKVAGKADVDGVSDGWETVNMNEKDPLTDKVKEKLNEIFSNNVDDTKGMYNFNNYIVVKNSPIIDDNLKKYDDTTAKNIEQSINSSINFQENIIKMNKTKLGDNEPIFGENNSPLHFFVPGQSAIRTINVYTKSNGGYIYHIMKGNRPSTDQFPEIEFDDKRKLIDYLTKIGAK